MVTDVKIVHIPSVRIHPQKMRISASDPQSTSHPQHGRMGKWTATIKSYLFSLNVDATLAGILKKAGIRKSHPFSKFQPKRWNFEKDGILAFS
jgi:hypothetical protein